jgi:hypothetical protein
LPGEFIVIEDGLTAELVLPSGRVHKYEVPESNHSVLVLVNEAVYGKQPPTILPKLAITFPSALILIVSLTVPQILERDNTAKKIPGFV